ncbi:MAG: DsrE family protein [Bacteroidia bacterium]|nr:DsrE family protein [Bacteroidia bacterium]
MKNLILSFFTGLLLVTATTFAQTSTTVDVKNLQTSDHAMHKVIFQMVSGDTLAHKALMHQLNNLKEVWGDAVTLEVLVQGPALDLLQSAKSTQKESIAGLNKRGIHFAACEFSMKQRHITKEEILPGVEFVKYGLVEIITKQEQGWSYLKGGF